MGSRGEVDETPLAKGHGEFDSYVWRDDNNSLSNGARSKEPSLDGARKHHKLPRWDSCACPINSFQWQPIECYPTTSLKQMDARGYVPSKTIVSKTAVEFWSSDTNEARSRWLSSSGNSENIAHKNSRRAISKLRRLPLMDNDLNNTNVERHAQKE